MHMANLVADHASGKRTRSENKTIVDSFPECENIRLRIHKLAGYVFSKRAKQRQITYKHRNALVNYKTIRIALDNDTRISRTVLMYQSALRSMYTLTVYFNQESAANRSVMLTPDEWNLLSGFEAAMRPICNLSFETQVDSQLTAGSSLLRVLKYAMNFMFLF